MLGLILLLATVNNAVVSIAMRYLSLCLGGTTDAYGDSGFSFLRDGQTVFTILVLFSSLQNFSTCEMFLYTVNPREKNGGFRFPKLT